MAKTPSDLKARAPFVGSAAHCRILEAESIHILREAAGQADNPVMLYSIGKDLPSCCISRARRSFPAGLPFPLLHIDTTWKFRDMIAFRDETARRLDLDLRVYTNPEGVRRGINPFDHDSVTYNQVMKTDALKQALTEGDYDFGHRRRAARRGTLARQGAGVLGPRPRPDLGPEAAAARSSGTSTTASSRRARRVRVFPLSNWTELDVWTYIQVERIPVVPLYFAAMRPTVDAATAR